MIPFPRFVINQIQFMYEHAPIIGMLQAEKLGGGGKVAGRSLAKRISQQASGAMMLYTFVSLRNTQDPGTLWYNVETEDGTVDLRPMLGPMNLELYIADTYVKLRRGEPQPNLVGFSQDMVQTAIGSSMRAGTGLQLVNDVLPSLLGDLDPDGATGGKISIANEQTLGRIAGDYFNTFTFPLPVSIVRDLYSLTDEQMRQIPETNGQVDWHDIMFARAGRTLGPIREMLGMENEKDPRYSIMRSTPAKKVDPLRTATTGFNISENANEVEKEANRLQVRPYEIYRRFKFGPADVSIREKVASELPQKMSGYIRGEEYKKQNNENKRKFFKEKAREIVTGISSKVLNELGTKIELFMERNPDATEDMIREEFGYTINDIMQYRYETEISKDNRAALESEIGKPTEDSNFSEYFFAGQVKSEQKLASGGLVQTFNVGGDVGDPLALSETAAEEDVATREQESEDYVKQMIELGLDLAPVTGEIRSAQSAIKDYEEGNYGMAALGALGAVPGVGIIGRGAKAGVKALRSVDKAEDIADAKKILGDEDAIQVWKDANRLPESQRQKRTPIVQQAAQDLKDGNITGKEYRKIAKAEMPMRPITRETFPEMPTLKEIVGSLGKNQSEKGIVGLNLEIPDGTRVGSRLDIPAYDKYDTWVVSLHDGTVRNGKAIGYGQTAVLDNVEFFTEGQGALNIATKKPKATIARIHGDYKNEDPEAVYNKVFELMDDPEWTQVGMNPFRHSFFYDKATGKPVTRADEVLQVGPLVLAKGARSELSDLKKLKIKSADGKVRVFNSGGLMSRT